MSGLLMIRTHTTEENCLHGTRLASAPVLIAILTACVSCTTFPSSEQVSGESVPNVVTADIQAGIEKHIEEETRAGGGYFRLSSGDKDLKLKLVRVHTEYLANLAARRHFACVDMASSDGDVYDVDFFLSGDPGDMTVTETTLHKVNGQPLYAWKQKRNGGWRRVPVKKASERDLGVITGQDEFEFIYRVTLPEITDVAHMWLPLPASDAFQKVEMKAIKTSARQTVLEEREYGNRILLLEIAPEEICSTVEIRFHVKRLEKPVHRDETADVHKYLRADRLVPADDEFREIAENVLDGKKGDLVRARALYDHVIDRMRYMKYGSGWGQGDAVYACDMRTGNCSDFHSYFIALARAAGIPARFAIGAAIPSERNEGGIDGYHCWAEFYTDGHWWPVDISEGDKCSRLATYYFGHHPANRFELSRGRDLVVDPGPVSGPINFLAYPVLEVGGEPVRPKVEFSFNRPSSHK